MFVAPALRARTAQRAVPAKTAVAAQIVLEGRAGRVSFAAIPTCIKNAYELGKA
jgi:hypothetical protein